MQSIIRPTICPSCSSRELELSSSLYEINEDDEITKKILEGTWFCKKCGDIMGTYNRGYNDVNPTSIEK